MENEELKNLKQEAEAAEKASKAAAPAPSEPAPAEAEEAQSVIKVKIGKKSGKDATPQKKRDRKLGDLFTGRRKKSIARIKLVKGSGKYTVNKKELKAYFGRDTLVHAVQQPLAITDNASDYDVFINVHGGGVTGQAEAARLAIARCIDAVDPKAHKQLREAGFLTRDSRMVERKKYGLHKARRAPQFSKR